MQICKTHILLFAYLLLVFTYLTCGSFFTYFVNVFPRDLRSSGSAQMAWLLNLGRLQFRAKQSRESNATTIGNAMWRTKLSWGRELSSPWLYHQSKAVAKKKCRKRSFFKIAFGCFYGKLPDVALAVCLGFSRLHSTSCGFECSINVQVKRI